MNDGSTFAPDHNTQPDGASFPVVRKHGFDQAHVLGWVKAANEQITDLQQQNDELHVRVASLEQLLDGELDDDTMVTTLGDETVRVLLAARRSAADIRERAETHARQRMQEADEYAHRISTSAEHAVAAMTKEAEDRAAASREEATRAAARIHTEASRARTDANEQARLVRTEAADALSKATEEAEQALDRAEEDAAAVRRAATQDANDTRTRAEREARELTQRFQDERQQLLVELRATRDQASRTLVMLNEKRESLAAVVAAVHHVYGLSAGLVDELQALDTRVLGDDDLTAFEEDLGTFDLEDADEWENDGRTPASDEDAAERDEADDDYDDEYDDYDDELDNVEADDFTDDYDDDEYDDYDDELDDANGSDGRVSGTAEGSTPSNGIDAADDASHELGVAPWWKKRAAG